MQKYKNISLSLAAYIIGIIWFLGAVQIGNMLVATHQQSSGIGNIVVIGVFFLLLLIGVFFGFTSNKKRESSWAGNLLAAIGIVIILGYLLLMSGFMGY